MFASIVGLGVDSFLACLVIGPVVARRRDRMALAAILGTADGCATFAASVGGMTLLLVAAAIALGALAIAVAVPDNRRLCMLPVLLSIDNLMTPLSPGDVVAAGVTSFAMAGLGFVASTLVFRAVPPRLHARVAIALGIVALVVIVRG